MGHYRANVRDLEFALFEDLEIADFLAAGPFEATTPDTVRSLLGQLRSLAENELADSFADGDRNPPEFDPATLSVTIPKSVKQAVAALVHNGWDRIHLPADHGGADLPVSVAWACSELILGANPVLFFYAGGKLAARIVHDHGTPAQQRFAQWMIDRDWAATMVLTEPDVGSDVGAVRTRAVRQPDGTWHLHGVKRFITAAAQDDMTDNVVHLVLARPEGPDALPGTKGLGLFVVPDSHVDPDTGELGERNGVVVAKLEEKLGIRASTTCELLFGDGDRPAVGFLLGDRINGIAQMFDLIGHARMMVGVKAVATLSTAYLTAVDYARTRTQGADLAQLLDRNAPKVPIIRHGDVRRSLMLQKSYAEGMRSLYLYTAALRDRARIDPDGGADLAKLHDLLLPVVKGGCSERAWVLLAEALQVLGGSGFTQDFPVEQYLRDGKIDTLYEGTTAIQSLDFFFRKIAKDGAVTVNRLLDEVAGTAAETGSLAAERVALAEGVRDVRAMLERLLSFAGAAMAEPVTVHRIGQHSVRFLLAVTDLLVGWRLVVAGGVASRALDGRVSAADQAFYTGKVAAAQFFCGTVLPGLRTALSVIETADDRLTAVPDEAF